MPAGKIPMPPRAPHHIHTPKYERQIIGQPKYNLFMQNAKEHHIDDTLSNLTIVQLSDFHYDPYYAEGSSSQCTDDICCRNTSQV